MAPDLRTDGYLLAFDTANESIALGLGVLDVESLSVDILASRNIEAHRASNTKLLSNIDDMMRTAGISPADLACVCVGQGPGSFTGVRIALATAKGIALALGISLICIPTQDCVAQNAYDAGARGTLLVVSDAMRKEVYPAHYVLNDAGVNRLDASSVIKAQALADLGEQADFVSGDALRKYADLFCECGQYRPETEWDPTGTSLLERFEAQWKSGLSDPFDTVRYAPDVALPIYTRLSDAEENERAKLAVKDAPTADLHTGVQGATTVSALTEQGEPQSGSNGSLKIAYVPFDAAFVDEACRFEQMYFKSDAWTPELFKDDIARKNRIWWMAVSDGSLLGYAGALVVDGDVQILKVAVRQDMRRQGIASELMQRVAYDAMNLAASTSSLEVRASNASAIGLYESMGYVSQGMRPHYYSDGEDACIMAAPLSSLVRNYVAGDRLDIRHPASDAHGSASGADVDEDPDINADEGLDAKDHASYERCDHAACEVIHPLILAIESSCDETCAAVIDGQGNILSDVVASQIDFHARFGGVVPEIASRKHIEAICGVARIALEETHLGIGWDDLDAVASTYAPGLVGALVVGVAFAKGAAWAQSIPFVGVNHLEGHLYANKIGLPKDQPFEPPAVVSLVSGGNTMLVHMDEWGSYSVLGATIDDAVGEAFDKVAKALGLPYPGGPIISKLAASGNPKAIDFPRALMHSKDFRFSLSGLKTAVTVYIDSCKKEGTELPVEDICASFQQAVIDVQVSKAAAALKLTGAKTFCLGGGVAANPELRRAYEKLCEDMDVRLIMPPLSACGDNAAMIALVALERYKQKRFFGLDADAYAHADLSEAY